jgi:hypothetical protein
MGGHSFCSLKQFINEEIHAKEAATANDAIQTVIDGKREVGYSQLSDDHLKTLKLNNIPYIKVPRKDNWNYYIFYTNKEKALRLLDISQKHNGILHDESFDEAVEIGKLLGYYDDDIDGYVFRRYHQSYKPFKLRTIAHSDIENLRDE